MYCAFRAAATREVDLHWLFVHSNHVHLGITDRSTDLSGFMQAMDRMIANCLIEHYAETHPHHQLDALWSRSSYSSLSLLTPEAVFKEMVYSLTNSVKDGQVSDYRKWPGVCSRPSDWAREIRHAERPEYFFGQHDQDWASVPYRFTVPPMLADRPLDSLIEGVESLIRDKQSELHGALASESRGVRGVRAILKTDPFDSPSSRRPKGKVKPTVAAGGNTALLREGLKLVRRFRQRYREAWKAYRAGRNDVPFPAGTLKMRMLHGVTCDVLDAPWCAAALAPG